MSAFVSGEDLVDVQLGLLAAAGGFLVLARQHLADQAEREELETDYHQQHAEREQRPLADRVAERFDDGEVNEDRESDQAEDQPEAAEEVQRPVSVAADEETSADRGTRERSARPRTATGHARVHDG